MPSRLAPVLLALALAAPLPGCVSRGRFVEVEAERNRLAERVALLERSNTSLSAERVALLDELEDLRQERENLEVSVAQLERKRDQLDAELERHARELAAREQELARTRSTYDALVADLESQVSTGQIQIEQLREGLRLNLSQEILFPPGSARLGGPGLAVLRTVAARLRELPHQVEVRGHSDDQPIAGALAERFPTNWELAAARAIEVVRLLEREGVGGGRLAAVSLGPNRPVASNATPDGRAKNRRIEIRLIPVHPSGQDAEGGGGPAPASPPAGG